MGISSFMAGFLESATERIETKEKEAREVNRIRAERQLKDIMEGQKIEKKRKMEIRKNLRTISNTTGGEVLSQDQKVIIAADPDRFKRFLSFAQKDPSGMLIKQQVKDIQGGDFKNMTLGQKIELFAKQDVPEVSATIKETATAFGLPLDDLDASIKAGAASAGMTEEEFLAGVARPTDKLPEFKEDLALDPSETLAQKADRISVLIVNEENKGEKANPDLLKDLYKQRARISQSAVPKQPTMEFLSQSTKESIKNIEKLGILNDDKYSRTVPGPDGQPIRVYRSDIDKSLVPNIQKYYEYAIRNVLNPYLGIKPGEEGSIIEDLNRGGPAFAQFKIYFTNPEIYLSPSLPSENQITINPQSQGTVKNYLGKFTGKSQIQLQDGSTANIQLDAN
jgi:hypothetical protein